VVAIGVGIEHGIQAGNRRRLDRQINEQAPAALDAPRRHHGDVRIDQQEGTPAIDEEAGAAQPVERRLVRRLEGSRRQWDAFRRTDLRRC